VTENTPPMRPAWALAPNLERVAATILVLFYAALTAYYIALDYSVAVSLQPWFTLVYGALGVLPGLLILARQRPRAPIAALAVFVVVLLALAWLEIGPRKGFLREAGSIRQGEALAEVDRRLAAYERFPATPGALDDGVMAVYRNPFGPGDADAVVVTFVEGRVVETDLLLD
jgi:hypothetical protein